MPSVSARRLTSGGDIVCPSVGRESSGEQHNGRHGDSKNDATSPAAESIGGAEEGKRLCKVSCLACRAAKRKCHTLNAFTTCRRCLTHSLKCEYKKHRRGRTKQHPRSADVLSHTVNVHSRAARTSMSAIPQGNSRDSQTHDDYEATNALGYLFEVAAEADPMPTDGDIGQVDSFGREANSSSRAVPVESTESQRLPSSTSRSGPGITLPQSHIRGRSDTVGSSTYSTAAKPSLGGRADLRFSHLVPVEGDSTPFLPGHTSPQATSSTYAQEQANVEKLLRSDCPDPISAGFVSEYDAYELFDFYFRHSNLTIAILDPVLHTCTSLRSSSPILFTAVLTVTAKIIRPKAYPSCLLLANKLVGQSVEHGLCSIEVVQAINLLTHWKKGDDTASWRRVGYAIRMAQELKLNVRAKRPLPGNERQAREILNKERCWLNLIIADYHLAIHHSLPRMITDEGIQDVADWVAEHPQYHIPGEAILAPLMTFSRMCRLYADLLAGLSGDPSNARLAQWIEFEWRQWELRWLSDTPGFDLPPQQLSTLKMCGAYYHFHIAEYRLLYTSRYVSTGQTLDMNEPTPLSLAFAEVVDTSLGVATCFQRDFVHHGYLPYCYHLVWVALAVTSIWLIKNIVPMLPADRARVIRTLSDIQSSTEAATRSSDDMAAYTHRLLKHLLGGVSPEWHFNSLVSPNVLRHTGLPVMAPGDGPNTDHAGTGGHSVLTSAQQMIQHGLSHDIVMGHGTDGVSSNERATVERPHPYLYQSAAGSPPPTVSSLGWTHPRDVPLFRCESPRGSTQCHGHSIAEGRSRSGVETRGDHAQGGDGSADNALENLLFPAADDEFWRNFFPVTDAGNMDNSFTRPYGL